MIEINKLKIFPVTKSIANTKSFSSIKFPLILLVDDDAFNIYSL
jgi:hypothetical protein